MPSITFLRSSLALWRRRYAYRHAKLLKGADNHKWGPLEGQAAQAIRYRTKQTEEWNATHTPPTLTHHTISTNGIDFIKSFEGYRGNPYTDSVGVWTIGYGHTEGVGPNTKPITETEASELLGRDLDSAYAPAVNALNLELTQNEFDALVSFVYNLGTGIVAPTTTIGADLRRHDLAKAANDILMYDHAGGNVLPGLTRRRQAERALFLKGE
jgi:lysozyme